MIKEIDVTPAGTLNDYDSLYHLADAVRELRVEASIIVPALRNRTVWMVNSAGKGGGVAEMLPRMVKTLSDLGLPTRWAVIGSDRPEFFHLTKRIHNLIHGSGHPEFTAEDRELYESVNAKNAEALAPLLKPDDIVVVHDPQPLALAAMLKRQVGVRTLWRCHIGLENNVDATRAAWRFLQPYAEMCDMAAFSAPEYIPDYLAGRSTIIHPGLDPVSHKNRELTPHKLVGVLCNAGLHYERHPVLTPRFENVAKRLLPDGSFGETNGVDEIGLLYRPVIAQISRWDRLKGFLPLLEGFTKLKSYLRDGRHDLGPRHRRRLEMVRLILAGPDPASIQDDPEAIEVLDSLVERYSQLDESLQRDIALLVLPMESRKQNAIMVNALQRCSTVVVQNSIQEGFGLTATEAMWKGVPIVGSRAHGLREQIRSGIDGTLVQDPNDPDEIAERLSDIMVMKGKRNRMAQSAQQRVRNEFLVFTQLRQWLQALTRAVSLPERHAEKSDED
jgi:trehalose synthase